VHKDRPLERGLSLQSLRASLAAHETLVDHVLKELVSERRVHVAEGMVARHDWQPGSAADDVHRASRIAEALEAAGAMPPSVEELTREFGPATPAHLRLLEREGRLIAVSSDRYYGKAAVQTLLDRLRAGTSDGHPRTAAELREMLGLTRKYLIPLLEYCDRIGVSIRRGDVREFRWRD
jgi:selenocysteine-specific elongation factor